ncbi:hypothetical protein AAG570_004624 [Ranatra chinensis]|uniref:Poly [ADP-ribose] polymerase n=1 Tax=Ranatra chinensis TaxID=642074 RepID=A0ABD0YG19_9HEMI
MTEQELPYRAEYAKSGRASCKGCKSTIEKESLRLAVLVQSPVFDGKVPHWYHFMCFFGKQRPKSIADIAHYDSLRWEDQEKIKKKLGTEEAATSAPVASGGKKTTKRAADKAVKSALKDYTVEYAKSSRAMCRGCEVKIAKDDVRISKKDFESEGAKMYGGQERWHHVECFAKLRDSLEFWESGDKLPGFATLKKEDKDVVLKSLPKTEPKEPKDEVDGSGEPEAKKMKKENDKESEELKKQNKTFFKYRDALKELSKSELGQLFAHNHQEDPPSMEKKYDRLADLMTFGSLEKCSVCKDGQLVYRTGIGYQCTGDMTEWTKCQNKEEYPKRREFKVPEELAEKYKFLSKYKCKINKRLIPKSAKPTVTTSEKPETSGPKIERFAPFKDMVFYTLGRLSVAKANLKIKIEKLGGTLASTLKPDVIAVISTPEEVEKCDSKMETVKKMRIHVVPESYIDECTNGNAIENITKYSICSWGSDTSLNITSNLISCSNDRKWRFQFAGQFTKSVPSSVKLKLKGGNAVDPDSKLEDIAHVYVKDKDVYSVVLGRTDLQSGRNSYYKIQLLVGDKTPQCWVFRSWGRIGTTIGGSKLDPMETLQQAKSHFKAVYLDQTGNKFSNRHNFVKVPNGFYPIDIDYGDSEMIKLSENSSVESKLHKSVQSLVSMIFDVDSMKRVMMEFELDLEKMPLGKLSKSQIQKAYSVLGELQQEDVKPNVVLDASNRFYTLIPHSFGIENPPLLSTKELIQTKLEMLESLLEMEVAYGLLKQTHGEGDSDMHPLDLHYNKLNSTIEILERGTEEFTIIEKYVKNTHAETHSHYELIIEDVFKVKRPNEEKRYKPFKKLHNKKLLWHGSRVTNYAGILSQGLRIAPPEAPVTGYMFGKGIYFADMVSKSANYCNTSMDNNVGLLLLCEVALGNMYEKTQAEHVTKLPTGMHSTKGCGATSPDPNDFAEIDGVQVPFGKPVTALDTSKTSLLYNEYPFLRLRCVFIAFSISATS